MSSSGSDNSGSDDERDQPAVKKARLHFGSLEDAERQRKEGGGAAAKAALAAGIEAGNINITASMDSVSCAQLRVARSQLNIASLVEPESVSGPMDPSKIADPVKEGIMAEFERRRKVLTDWD